MNIKSKHIIVHIIASRAFGHAMHCWLVACLLASWLACFEINFTIYSIPLGEVCKV